MLAISEVLCGFVDSVMFAVIPSCSPRFRGESRVSAPWRVARAGSVPPRVSAQYGPRVAPIPAAYGAG
ncbi:hypothetical protein, partial [Streptomyces buecherae]|uniref:hypothetical protein n=1 Tax=Streptomyces buecherae TaxID=2763006 RepID=UPI001C9B9EC9